jgi:hypothetical protein
LRLCSLQKLSHHQGHIATARPPPLLCAPVWVGWRVGASGSCGCGPNLVGGRTGAQLSRPLATPIGPPCPTARRVVAMFVSHHHASFNVVLQVSVFSIESFFPPWHIRCDVMSHWSVTRALISVLELPPLPVCSGCGASRFVPPPPRCIRPCRGGRYRQDAQAGDFGFEARHEP